MRKRLPYEWDGKTPITRADMGLTIRVEGEHLVHFCPKNHLGMGDDVRYQIVSGPATIGDRWYARSVRSLVDDDGGRWLVGFGASCSVESWGCTFGSCPNGHAVAWRERDGERWTHYA
jgi:hypothetical protein